MSTLQTRVEDGQDNKEQRVRRGEPDHASQRQMAASSEVPLVASKMASLYPNAISNR